MGFDEIWARTTRVLGFVAGLLIMIYETIGDHSDRPYLYAAAVGMMGLPVARTAEAILGRIGRIGTPRDKLEIEIIHDEDRHGDIW